MKNWLERKNQTLVFAMNGGMYLENRTPLGLFVEDGKIRTKLNTRDGNGNFYLKPNGVFCLTADNSAEICITGKFNSKQQIRYATQSGPMLLIDGKIHSAFAKDSRNLNIRNGVGILPDKKIVFAMSRGPVNFYGFAEYFQKLGCKNALYLDGFVSRMYLPEQNWVQTNGDFGVIIGVTKK